VEQQSAVLHALAAVAKGPKLQNPFEALLELDVEYGSRRIDCVGGLVSCRGFALDLQM
jgi:hypothetical protein